MLPLPTLDEIEMIRQGGYRPEVMISIVHDRRILFVYHREHDLWQFIQGGIDQGEGVSLAAFRETGEELGEEFARNLRFLGVIREDKLLLNHNETKPVILADGTAVPMAGKYFYCVLMRSESEELPIGSTQFDDHAWLEHDQALARANGIYQKGKQRVTVAMIMELDRSGY